MKAFSRILFLLLVLLGLYPLEAQERILDGDEYVALKNKAFSVFNNTPYREIVTVDVRDDPASTWKSYSKGINEYVRPDRMHTWLTNIILGHHDTGEIVAIGNRAYTRGSEDAPWRTQESGPLHAPVYPQKDTNPLGDVIEYRQLGTEIISGQQSRIVRKTTYSKRVANGETVDVSITETNWFDEKGKILKLELLTTNIPVWPFKIFRTTTSYEYDPNIKIEPPIK